MARNDGIDRTVARNQDVETADDLAKVQEHNEREKDSYSNEDIEPERSSLNVHFKAPTAGYAEMFEQMEQDKVISTRGLKADAVKYGELVFDVNSAYFYNHGGYEFAKQFYADAYKAAVEIVGGEQYILSAVMHADERNRAMSEALGEDVYHYHLHVVYIPVVKKQILWSKRCKDEALRGTVKETIMQVSRSKKWTSQIVLDEAGNPLLTSKGKKVLRPSYSILQDNFWEAMRSAGYTDVERGERGSTEEHLTVTQFKVAQEKQRLETMTAQIAQTEQTLNNTQAVIEKKEKELQSLQKQAKEQHAAALTVQEIRSMGKKTITGNVSFTPSECNILKDYAVTGLLVKAENSRLEEKLRSAQCSAAIWKQRYDALYNAYQELKKEVQPYLDAVKLAPEKVRAFFDELLTRTRQARQPTKPIRRKQDMER
ncbi:plasmid recombination protein [uncultured Ruminococcus sp.]|nr:plasmid recombination protein [uncultured Ruminococcus sp.]